MNQEQVVQTLTEKNGLSPEINEKVVNDFLAIVTDCLTMGDSVKMTGFGTFDVCIGKPREVVNPQTMEMMKIGYYFRPSFRAGRALKASIRNSEYLHDKMLEADSLSKQKAGQKKAEGFK